MTRKKLVNRRNAKIGREKESNNDQYKKNMTQSKAFTFKNKVLLYTCGMG